MPSEIPTTSPIRAALAQMPLTAGDEFWQGMWWLPDGEGRLRNASVRECATEIQRLRARVKELEDGR